MPVLSATQEAEAGVLPRQFSKTLFQNRIKSGWRRSPVAEWLARMFKALSLVPRTRKNFFLNEVLYVNYLIVKRQRLIPVVISYL